MKNPFYPKTRRLRNFYIIMIIWSLIMLITFHYDVFGLRWDQPRNEKLQTFDNTYASLFLIVSLVTGFLVVL